jgi:hypothetical protein
LQLKKRAQQFVRMDDIAFAVVLCASTTIAADSAGGRIVAGSDCEIRMCEYQSPNQSAVGNRISG